MAAVVDRELTETVRFKFLPAPPGTSKRIDESDVHELIKNAVGPTDKYGPSFALTLTSSLPKFAPNKVIETLPVAGPLPDAKTNMEC